jgi:hypothetical protein
VPKKLVFIRIFFSKEDGDYAIEITIDTKRKKRDKASTLRKMDELQND